MAVELSRLKGLVKESAEELDLSASRLSKWRNNPELNGGKIMMDVAGLSADRMEIRSLSNQFLFKKFINAIYPQKLVYDDVTYRTPKANPGVALIFCCKQKVI